MGSHNQLLRPAGQALVTALTLCSIAMVVFYAPIDPVMGICQKIVYLHVPAAVCAFIACLAVFVGSVGYIWQRRSVWDDMANAAAQVAVVFCTVVLVTGMVWAKDAWGHWWSWSPRLTFSLILWVLFAAYLTLRPAFAIPQRRALVCAVYGIIAFLDVPLVYLSTRLMPDVHPAELAMDAKMHLTLAVCMLSLGLLAAVMLQKRLNLNIRSRRFDLGDREHEGSPAAPGIRPHPRAPISGSHA